MGVGLFFMGVGECITVATVASHGIPWHTVAINCNHTAADMVMSLYWTSSTVLLSSAMSLCV